MRAAEQPECIYEAAYFFASGLDAVSGLLPDITAILDGYRVPVTGWRWLDAVRS